MKTALLIVIAVSLPAFLAATNVRLLATTPAFYEWGFRSHEIGQRMGLTDEQLRGIAFEFIRYFQSPPGRMDVRVSHGEERVPLFNEREIAHMVDVQALIHTLGTLQLVAGVALVLGLLGLAAAEHRPLGPVAGRGLLSGAIATLALLVVVGLATFIDFSSLWTRFHHLAFTNDLWQLDPSRDNLIRLYPPEFWESATLLLGGLMALGSLLPGVIGLTAWLVGRQPRLHATSSTTLPPLNRSDR